MGTLIKTCTLKYVNIQTLNNCCKHSNKLKLRFYNGITPLKYAEEIANSADPDQTAPLLGLPCLHKALLLLG